MSDTLDVHANVGALLARLKSAGYSYAEIWALPLWTQDPALLTSLKAWIGPNPETNDAEVS